MDPNKDTEFRKNDTYISPLHEMLRGTTAMPVVVEHAPEIQPTPAPIPPASSIASAGFMPSPENQQEMMLAQRRFLTTPLSDNISYSDQMQILSMEPPPITSLLQGEPTAIVHAHLNVSGVMDPGPIFNDLATQTLKEEDMHKSLGSSSHSYPDGKMTYVEPTSFGQSPISYYVPREPQVPIPSGTSDGFVQATVSTTAEVERARRAYPCRICTASFYSPQALGGHMSYHSKEMKKK
ncbi:hypothetical protein ACP70R_037559 [Stipagrostis hirtigluma subsp. patula]